MYFFLITLYVYQIFPLYCVSWSMACLDHNFQKNVFNMNCEFFSLQLYTWNFILERLQWDITTNTSRACLKCFMFCLILTKLEFSWQILIKSPIYKFTKIRPAVAKLFHVDKKTDRHDEAVTFHNFANMPKNLNFVR